MSLKSNYEYIRDWCNHKFLTKDEQISVDLSNYYTKSEVDSAITDATDDIDLSNYVTDSELATGLSTKQNTISDLSTIRSNAAAGAAKVSNVQSDWNATSGLARILNKPDLDDYLTIEDYTQDEEVVAAALNDLNSNKQATLVSGTNIKTVKGTSLLGPGNIDVQDGKSAYQLWLDQGNVGTEAEFIASLKGSQGDKGDTGAQGPKGEKGDAAGFGTIRADINGGVGIPGVSVESSGDNTAKNLMFHFTNLKGETGVTSVVATIDDTSGTPSCQASLVNGVLTLAFSGLKGIKGDTGVSADYPITLYNGLDSDATDQALAAAQGKVLDGKISQLGQDVINGGTISEQVFDHSAFSSATVELPSTITLAQVGDYVEIKVKGTDSNSIIKNTAPYNSPQIYYSGNSTLTMRLVGKTGSSFSYSGTGVSRGTVQIIKLVLSSISGTTRNFTLYIDGVERTPSTPITADQDVTFAFAGNATTMDLYYIKGKSSGADFNFNKFSEYTVSSGTVEDVYVSSGVQSFSGLLQDEQDIAELRTGLSDVSDDVVDLNEKTDTILSSGGSTSTFDNSTFANNAFAPVSLSLANVGDSAEVKVRATNNGYILFDSTAAYNNPHVCYSSANTLQVRLSQTSTFAYQNTAVVLGQIQTIKVVLTDITAGTYTFTMYLDGVNIGTGTTSAPVTFDRIGNNVTMDLYYVKYNTDLDTTTYTAFSEMTGASGTITDNYVTRSYDGIVELTERVGELENEIDSFLGEEMLYQYHSMSSFWYCDHDFCIFQRLKGYVYLMTVLGFYKPTGNEYPKGYWRIERSRIVTIVDNVITTVQDSVLTAGENEFVLKWLAGDSYNAYGGFTGGFHMGESVEESGAWVEFIIDGNVVTPSDDIPLTACQSFLYREYTPIYNCNDSPATVAAWHLKETEFKDGGYETTNDLKLIQALSYFAYTGIVCVSRWLSQYAMPENVATITDMGDGSTTIAEQFKSNGHRIHYEGNGYMCDVESEVLIGADDTQCQRVVYNSPVYNKFYRRNPKTEGSVNNRLKGRTKVKISAM